MIRASAIILAGGKSQRMGCDKGMLDYRGRPLIQHVVEQLAPLFESVIIGVDDLEKYSFLGLPCVLDEKPGLGPLMAIVSCLEHSPYELNFVTGCDIPYIDPDFINKLFLAAKDFDIVMPRTSDGKFEPLLALYRKSISLPARALLAEGKHRIIALFNHVRVTFIDMPEGDWYHNINTLEDYRRAKLGHLS